MEEAVVPSAFSERDNAGERPLPVDDIHLERLHRKGGESKKQ